MGKISYKNKKGKINIINAITYPECINEQKLKLIASRQIDCLLPLTVYEKRKQILIECSVENRMTLSQYLQGVISRQMFLDVVLKLIEIIKTCEKNNLDLNNLALKNDMIFVDVANKSLRCIFWPIVNNQIGCSLADYFRRLPCGLSFNPFDDSGYLAEYRQFFESLEPFSLKNFEKLILKLSGKEIAKSYTIIGTNDTEIKKNDGFKKGIEYDPFSADNSSASAGANRKGTFVNPFDTMDFDHLVQTPGYNAGAGVVSGMTAGAGLNHAVHPDGNTPVNQGGNAPVNQGGYAPVNQGGNAPVNQGGYAPVNQGGYAPANQGGNAPTNQGGYAPVNQGGNAPINQGGYAPANQGGYAPVNQGGYAPVNQGGNIPVTPQPTSVYLVLTKMSTGERVYIMKPEFVMGKGVDCDLCIQNNQYISKEHAKLLVYGDRYFVVDCNSTNKTYVDGEMLFPGREREIFNGSNITLANEKLLFSIEMR